MTNDHQTTKKVCLFDQHRLSDAGEVIRVQVWKETDRNYYTIRHTLDGRHEGGSSGPNFEDIMADACKLVDQQTHKEWSKAENEWVSSFPEHLQDAAAKYQSISVSLTMAEYSDTPANRARIDDYKSQLSVLTDELGLGKKSLDDTGEALGEALKKFVGADV